MELTLTRIYYAKGTNGLLQQNGMTICRTIELPWKSNLPLISCIPEGRYRLQKRFTHHRGYHLEVMNVPCRTWILVHPANDALEQLEGCIAPVTTVTGEGRGAESRAAFDKLLSLVYAVIDEEQVWLTISSAAVVRQPCLVRTLTGRNQLRLCA
ncbi:MAG TPA: DUF5675 family protein [Chitinophagaceae bacterium]|nr:DUF5675 family protein [Chitinophagaceae bacterium]